MFVKMQVVFTALSLMFPVATLAAEVVSQWPEQSGWRVTKNSGDGMIFCNLVVIPTTLVYPEVKVFRLIVLRAGSSIVVVNSDVDSNYVRKITLTIGLYTKTANNLSFLEGKNSAGTIDFLMTAKELQDLTSAIDASKANVMVVSTDRKSFGITMEGSKHAMQNLRECISEL